LSLSIFGAEIFQAGSFQIWPDNPPPFAKLAKDGKGSRCASFSRGVGLFGRIFPLLAEWFRSIENKKFPMKTNKNIQDLTYEMQNNKREKLDLRTLVDRTAEMFR
jgi:hypothetical protein